MCEKTSSRYETLHAKPQAITISTIFHISSHKKSIFGSLTDSRIAFHSKANRFADCSSLDLTYKTSLTYKTFVIYICTSRTPRYFKYDSNRKMYHISDTVHINQYPFRYSKIDKDFRHADLSTVATAYRYHNSQKHNRRNKR